MTDKRGARTRLHPLTGVAAVLGALVILVGHGAWPWIGLALLLSAVVWGFVDGYRGGPDR